MKTNTNVGLLSTLACLLLLKISGYFSFLGFAIYLPMYILSYIIPYAFVQANISRTSEVSKGKQPLIRIIFLAAVFLSAMIVFSLTVSNLAHESEQVIYRINAKTIILSGILAPILEELFWRDALLSAFKENGKLQASLASAVFFGLLHDGNAGLCYAVFSGLLFAVLYYTSDSIFPSVIIHITNNITSLLSLKFGGAVLILLFLSLITALVSGIASKKFSEKFNLADTDDAVSYKLFTNSLFYISAFIFLFFRYLG